ncbi:MAG: hypothetical protein OEV66_01990 [Spirochaetia bacterium]|nr:hypothetical protein [Spirochaetia bacterium]
MKKLKLVLGFLIVLGFSAQFTPVEAAGPNFKQGNFFLGPSVGLGFGFGFGSGLSLPLGLNAEYAVTKDIGVGAYVGFVGFGILGASYSLIPIQVTGMYHFDIPDNPKLDVALGLALGYTLSSGPFFSGYNWFAWGVFINARYFLSNKVALKGRLGWGISALEIGVDFKL